MELSELVRFQEHLLAMCHLSQTGLWDVLQLWVLAGDITGLVFEVDPEEGQAFQRLALADGNGRSMKPFKAEWATVKDLPACFESFSSYSQSALDRSTPPKKQLFTEIVVRTGTSSWAAWVVSGPMTMAPWCTAMHSG